MSKFLLACCLISISLAWTFGCTDGGFQSNESKSVAAAPVVTAASVSLSLPAGAGASVASVSATNSPTSFSITSGNPNNAFTIDNSGQISVAPGLLTAPAGTFALTVQATNEAGSGSAVVTISSSMPAPSGYPISKQTFLEQFAGTTLDLSVWQTNMGDSMYGTWQDAGKLPPTYSAISNDDGGSAFNAEYGDPAQVSVNYGLKLKAEPSSLFAGDSTGLQYYTWKAGYLRTVDQSFFSGGYIQILARQPDSSSGMWPALWFLNGGGEIDLQEGGYTGGGGPNQNMSSALHTAGNSQTIVNTGVDLSAGYHIYGVEYIPGVSIKTYLDGVLIATFTNNIPSGAYELIMVNSIANSNAAGFHSAVSGSTPTDQFDIAEVQMYGL
jgi:hypothetical protein